MSRAALECLIQFLIGVASFTSGSAAYWSFSSCPATEYGNGLCFGGVVASLTGALPRCAAMYTLGAVTLELGSLANAVHELRPTIALAGARDRRLRAACTALMWASNLLAVYWVLLYATTFTETAVERDGVVGRWSAAVVGCGLAAVRQRDLLKRNADEDDAASNGARALDRPERSRHQCRRWP